MNSTTIPKQCSHAAVQVVARPFTDWICFSATKSDSMSPLPPVWPLSNTSSDLEHQLENQSAHGGQIHQHGGPGDVMGPMPPTSMGSPPTSQGGVRTSSGGLSIGSLVHPSTEYRYNNLATPTYSGFSRPAMPYNGFLSSDESYYTPDGSQSPASEAYSRFAHRQSISSSSSVAAFDPNQASPLITGGNAWVPSSAPPNVLPANMFEDPTYFNVRGLLLSLHAFTETDQSSTDSSIPIPLTNLDGDEFDIIRRELSYAPGIVPASDGNGIPDAIRWDCLEHYWQNFHPFFPIVHRPTFLPTKPSPLLASAMVAIGSQFDRRSDAKQYSLVLLEVATRLLRRRDNITSRSRLADLQTVFLLEALSKYFSRRVEVEMSPRFRALFASLDQARRTLTTSSLAVFRTLRPEHSKEELTKAHKFWVDHETRRRVLQAFSILDMQQTSLFEQPATIMQHGRTRLSTEVARATMSLPCSQDLWESSPVDDWKTLATEQQQFESSNASLQLDDESKLDYFQSQALLQSDPAPLQQFHFDSDSHLLSSIKEGTDRKSMEFNRHAMTLAKCTPLRSLLLVSGESWIFGKKLESEQDFQTARTDLRNWVSMGNGSLTALWHATALLRSQITFSGDDTTTADFHATFPKTQMLHEPWCIYLAALVCWAHGLYPSISHNASGAASRAASVMSAPTSSHSAASSSSGHPSLMDSTDAAQGAHAYLQATDVATPGDLAQLEPASLGKMYGLIELVRMQKILPLLGGLMNEAERVLFRLVEGRSTFPHF